MASRIEQMPPEILLEICEYLDAKSYYINAKGTLEPQSKDLLSLRKTSKLFAAVGLKVLFRHIGFVTTEKSLSRLKAISEDAKLGPLVRSLFWEMHTLPHYETMEDWAVDARCGKHVNRADYASDKDPFFLGVRGRDKKRSYVVPSSLAHASWNQYQQIRDFQELFPEIAQFYFSSILPGLSNLGSLHFRREHWGAWKGPSCRSHYTNTLLRTNYHDQSSPYGASELYNLLSATALARRPLFGIDSMHLSYHFFQQPLTYLCQNQMFNSTLDSLTSILLRICLDEGTFDLEEETSDISSTPGAIAIQKGGLSTFLRTLPKLENLLLQFSHMDCLYSEPGDAGKPVHGLHINDVLGTTTWTKLRRLDLTWISSDSESLIRVIDGHSSTLEMLKLTNVHLIDGHWATMFDYIQGLEIAQKCLSRWFTCSDPVEIFHADVVIEANESVQFCTGGLAFGNVRLWTSHSLSRLLTGKKYKQDDEITACVDYWLRGDGRTRLGAEWGEVDCDADGDPIDFGAKGCFAFDSRDGGADQKKDPSLSFGPHLLNELWKADEDIVVVEGSEGSEDSEDSEESDH